MIYFGTVLLYSQWWTLLQNCLFIKVQTYRRILCYVFESARKTDPKIVALKLFQALKYQLINLLSKNIISWFLKVHSKTNYSIWIFLENDTSLTYQVLESRYNCSNNPWQWLKSKKWSNQFRNLRLNWMCRSAITACLVSWKWRSILLATRDLESLFPSVLHFNRLGKEKLSLSRILKIRSLGFETPSYQIAWLVIETILRICTNFVI